MGYPQPGMSLANPVAYGHVHPQGYGAPVNQTSIPRGTGAPTTDGIAPGPRPGPHHGTPGVIPATGRPPQGHKCNLRNGPPPSQAGAAPAAAGTASLPLDTALLFSPSPMEQKQMFGNVIYMRIVRAQPELARKPTAGMVL